MKRLFQKIRSAAEFLLGWAVTIIGGLVLFITVLMYIKLIFEPLGPLITIALALWGTVYAWQRWGTRIVSIVGLAMYVASWPLAYHWNLYGGVAICCAGFLTWFLAVCWPALRQPTKPVPATC
jgi:hypothetical protein